MDTTLNLALPVADADHFRVMLREQLAGDSELLREVDAGFAPDVDPDEVWARVALVDRLADQVGGLYGSRL